MTKFLQITLEVEIEMPDKIEEGVAESTVEYVRGSIKTHLGGLAVDVTVMDWDVG